MQITLATTYMAIFTTGIFLCLLTICLINKTLLIRFGYKLLGLFALFTLLRFSLPVEFSFTKDIALPLPTIVSDIIAKLRHRLFSISGQPVSIWLIFQCVWIIGAICSILLFIISYIRDSYHIILYGKEMTNSSPYQELVAHICDEQNRHNNFRVVEIPDLDTPRIFGIITPRILLPENIELSEDQAYFILRHEMTHHFHHDLLLKSLIKLITLIYWWNPLCNLLNRQADVILEMHVDDSLTHSSTEDTTAYMRCLTDYASGKIKKSSFSHTFTLGLLPWEDSDLKKRFYLMVNNQKKKDLPLSILICCIVVGIYICSYLFIFEGFRAPAQETMSRPPSIIDWEDVCILGDTPSYFIDNGNGTYDLYSGDMYLETMTSIEGYYSGIPVYTPDTNPYKKD